MKLGTLYIELLAKVTGFTKGMGEALDSVEKFSKKVKGAADETAQIGLAMAAAAGAAAIASKGMSVEVDRTLDETSKLSKTLAVELTETLLPAIRAVNEGIRGVVGAFQSMSPEMQAAISDLALFGLQATASLFILGKVAGAVGGLSALASALLPVLTAVAAPLASIAAFAAAVTVALVPFIVTIGIAYNAWGKYVGFVVAGAEKISTALQMGFQIAGVTISGVIRSMTTNFLKGLDMMLAGIQTVASVAAALPIPTAGAGALAGSIAEIRKAMDPANLLKGWERISTNIQLGAQVLVASAEMAGRELFAESAAGWKKLISDVGLDQTIAQITALFGTAGQIRQSYTGIDVGSGGAAVQGMKAPSFQPLVLATADMMGKLTGLVVQGLGQVFTALGRAVASAAHSASTVAADLVGQAVVDGVAGLRSVIDGARQGAAAGGPAGAAAGAFAALLAQSAQFESVMIILGQGLEVLANIVGVVMEPMIPLAAVVRELFVSLAPLAELYRTLSPILTIGLQALTGLIYGLGVVIRTIINFFNGEGWDSFGNAVNDMQASMNSAGSAAKGLAESAQAAADAILNAPRGFRVEAYRYAAEGAGGGGGAPTNDPLDSAPGGVNGDPIDTGGEVIKPPVGRGPRGPLIGRGPLGGGGIIEPGPKGGGGQPPKTEGAQPINIEITLQGSTVRDWVLNRDASNFRQTGTRISVGPKYSTG